MLMLWPPGHGLTFLAMTPPRPWQTNMIGVDEGLLNVSVVM